MMIAGVLTVRDEADVLPLNLMHHRAVGIDQLWVVDNGSSDGTTEVLRLMARTHPWLHWRSEHGPFQQSEFVTGLAQAARRAGADWIVPIDVDEFWWTSRRSFHDIMSDSTVGAFASEVQNFVQDRRIEHDNSASLLTMTYRAEQKGSIQDARALVEAEKIGFVEMAYPPKLAMRATSSLVIGLGNHNAEGLDGPTVRNADLSVLHAPIRSRARLKLLAAHGRRIAAVNPDPGTSWHLRRWATLDSVGSLSSDWSANSQRRGALEVGDAAHPVRRDDRLRDAVLPFVSRAQRRRAYALRLFR